MSLTLADLKREHFEPLVEQVFTVALPDELTEQLLLVSIDNFGDEIPPGLIRAPFSLNFRGVTPGLMLNQRTQSVEHSAIGRHDLFVVPVGQNSDGTYLYQMVFG